MYQVTVSLRTGDPVGSKKTGLLHITRVAVYPIEIIRKICDESVRKFAGFYEMSVMFFFRMLY